MNSKKKTIGLVDRLKEEHSIIVKELVYLEKSLVRVGNNLDTIKRFLDLFDNKIFHIIKIEEKVLFPCLEQYIEKDGPLLVMCYTHDIIRSEFEKLRNALSEKDTYSIHKSVERLIEVLRFHIEKEDSIILKEAEKRIDTEQTNLFSNILIKTIGKNPSLIEKLCK